MLITHVKINRMTRPLGFSLDVPRVSWQVEDTPSRAQTAARVEVSLGEAFDDIVFDTGRREDLDSLGVLISCPLSPRTRYHVRVSVWGDAGDEAVSEPTWFETAKLDEPWQARWISPAQNDPDARPLMRGRFSLSGSVRQARAYVCGLGVYEMYVNGEKAGDECLAPGLHAYDKWLQYQTYDITSLLCGGDNCVGFMLGSGWYGSRVGFTGKTHCYGDTYALLCEIHVTLEDGTCLCVGSGENWLSHPGPVLMDSIYDGETLDARLMLKKWSHMVASDAGWSPVRSAENDIASVPFAGTRTEPKDETGYERLCARLSPPVRVMRTLHPTLIQTPSGDRLLDMGQNMVGWLRMRVSLPRDAQVLLQFGEALVKGEFFRDNLRSAKQEYSYISDGETREVRPFFTFFGFRYVRLTQWPGDVNPEDFEGLVLYSDMEETGDVTTDDPRVNQLIQNIHWGRRGNFLDVPTDCPQRDERMGWTGDTQAFSGTALFSADCAAFYHKYLHDAYLEQLSCHGETPSIVPVCYSSSSGSAAWSDVSTILPWNLYLHTGDREALAVQYAGMRALTEYMARYDAQTGGTHLICGKFHFGDWLAMDGDSPTAVYGGTEHTYIATAYYAHSAHLTAMAARVLSLAEDAERYEQLFEQVRAAFMREYITPDGRLAVRTQTAFALALQFGLTDHPERLGSDLRDMLRANSVTPTTGFVGTIYLNRVLSRTGSSDYAFRILLREGVPGWLYAVNKGATTVWERWNSILEDGTFSDLSMNSLNHYAYGSILEWLYRDAAGLNPDERAPGFRFARLAPRPDGVLRSVHARVRTCAGLYECGYDIDETGVITVSGCVPFGCEAELCLPESGEAPLRLRAGEFSYTYTPLRNLLPVVSIFSTAAEIVRAGGIPSVRQAMGDYFACSFEQGPRDQSLADAIYRHRKPYMPGALEKLEEALRALRPGDEPAQPAPQHDTL